MGWAIAAVMLITVSGPQAVASPPDVLFTPVDENDEELGDSYPALCAEDVCRAAVPVNLGRHHACMVNAWVAAPGWSGGGLLLLSIGPCRPGFAHATSPAGDVSHVFSLDRLGAASFVVALPNVTDDWAPLGDFVGGDKPVSSWIRQSDVYPTK